MRLVRARPAGERRVSLFFLLRKVLVLALRRSQGRSPRGVQEGSAPPIHPRILPTSPYLQAYEPNIYIIVRSSLPQDQLLSRVKGAVRTAYADQAVFNVLTMEEVLSNSVNEPRYRAFLIGAFALLALAMACSGMYSVVSCLVSDLHFEWRLEPLLGRVPQLPRLRFKRRPRLRLAPETMPEPAAEVEMSRVDQILQKIYESGQMSLTDEERAVLRDASQRIKNRARDDR